MIPDVKGRRPIYLGVADTLKTRIESGKFLPGDHLPPERELVREFNCSRATIRLAVDRLISLGMAERRPKRGVVVRGMQTGRRSDSAMNLADTVSLVLPSANWHTNAMRILNSCQSALYQNSYYAIVCDIGYENLAEAMHKEVEYVESMVAKGVPGIIVWPAHEQEDVEIYRRAQAAGVSVVVIDHEIPGLECDYVGSDNVGGGYEATRHLIAHGHKRIAHITLPVRPSSVIGRINGYRKALDEAGIEYDESLVVSCWAHTGELDGVVRQLVSMDDRPTAIFCATDQIASGTIGKLSYLGMSIPHDIAIIGFDDEVFAKWSPVPLTTVEQPFEVIGQEAVRLLMSRLRHRTPSPPRRIILPVRLVIRQSCGLASAHTGPRL